MNKDLKEKFGFTLAEGATHVGIFHNTRRVGFTLAEVLITLGIIGIVSALTIPNLINKFEEKRTVTLLKETYSMLSQAMIYAVNENGPAENWDRGTQSMSTDDIFKATDNFANIFTKYLRISRRCGNTKKERVNCWGGDTDIFTQLNGSKATLYFETASSIPYILANGAKFMLNANDSNMYPSCKNVNSVPCGVIYIKTNNQKDNIMGKNIFRFGIYSDKIMPMGHQKATYNSFANTCQTHHSNSGLGCTAWVIENGNMDYLHCDDLSWNGKRKCD